jgi:hypothetical protein
VSALAHTARSHTTCYLAGPVGGPGAEACDISPRDRDADPDYGGDTGVTRLRPLRARRAGGLPCYAGDETRNGGAAFGRGPEARRPGSSYFHN